MSRSLETLRRVSVVVVSMSIVVLGWPALPAHAAAQVTSIANASITEGDTGTTPMTFKISDKHGSVAETVHWATSDGTATAPADYIATSGTASLPGNGCRCALVKVPIVGDKLDEANETFTVTISNVSAGTIGSPTATGTIIDNDPTPTLSVNSVSHSEGNLGTTNAPFTVTLSAVSGRSVSVNYATSGGSATSGVDFTGTSGSLSFAPGQTTKIVNVPVIGDTTYEPTETYSLQLSGASNAGYGTATGTGTIVNDDGVPVVGVNDVSQVEGNAGTSGAIFTVSLSNPSFQTVTVAYATADGTALAGSDYVAAGGILTFNPGQTSKPVTVLLNGDTLRESDETYSLDLSAPTNASIADAQGVGTILNDDAQPSVSVGDASVSEGDSGLTAATFTVSLTNPSDQSISVDWTTADATATAGSDYVAGSGTVTFAPGETSKNVTVQVNGDTTFETDETYSLDLSAPTNASIADAQGVGTILNDDAQPSVSVGDASVSEGDSGLTAATFTVSLTNPSDQSISVDWTTADATATAGSDYVAGSGTVTFAPGETSKNVTVQVNGDTTFETDETYSLDLSAPTNASIATARAWARSSTTTRSRRSASGTPR